MCEVGVQYQCALLLRWEEGIGSPADMSGGVECSLTRLALRVSRASDPAERFFKGIALVSCRTRRHGLLPSRSDLTGRVRAWEVGNRMIVHDGLQTHSRWKWTGLRL